jgi:hypothetical protein
MVTWNAKSRILVDAVAPDLREGVYRVVNLSTDAPIPGATVTLSLTNARTLRPLSAARPSFPEVKTDEQGRFAFRSLDAGIHGLGAERQGFLRAGYRSSGSHTVVLGENQALSSALLGLMPDTVIAAKVRAHPGSGECEDLRADFRAPARQGHGEPPGPGGGCRHRRSDEGRGVESERVG